MLTWRRARTLPRTNEIEVESERRAKAVLESQETQLVADLHAKEAALTLQAARIVAPADSTRRAAGETGTTGSRVPRL